jgi:hypothetical protein
MAHVRLDTARITDWPSFQAECQRALGFPASYGANMNAWIDCLSYLREDCAAGMANIELAADELLALELPEFSTLKARVPEIVAALVESTSVVNQRYVQAGGGPALALVPVEGVAAGA